MTRQLMDSLGVDPHTIATRCIEECGYDVLGADAMQEPVIRPLQPLVPFQFPAAAEIDYGTQLTQEIVDAASRNVLAQQAAARRNAAVSGDGGSQTSAQTRDRPAQSLGNRSGNLRPSFTVHQNVLDAPVAVHHARSAG